MLPLLSQALNCFDIILHTSFIADINTQIYETLHFLDVLSIYLYFLCVGRIQPEKFGLLRIDLQPNSLAVSTEASNFLLNLLSDAAMSSAKSKSSNLEHG